MKVLIQKRDLNILNDVFETLTNSFAASFPILYPLKTPENEKISDVIKWWKYGNINGEHW